MVPGSPVLSLPQTMEMLGCGRSRVFELLAEGILEQAPRFGRNIRIYRDSVEKALARPKPRGRRQHTARRPSAGLRINPDEIPR